MTTAWTCTQCGACCRALGLGILAGDVSELPVAPDGVCGNLDRETNLCRIYDTRPACCRVTPAHSPAALTDGCDKLHLAVYGQERAPAPPTEREAVVQGSYVRASRGQRGHEPGLVAWGEHEKAWQEYARRYGRRQSAEMIHERGGFGYGELTMLLGHEPMTWRPR